jgi:hypothetical protein
VDPCGIGTRFDQHSCYSMDRMARPVDTFNPFHVEHTVKLNLTLAYAA